MSSEKKADALGSDNSSELTAVVDDLLNQLTTKFSAISADMISKMDEMSKRLDTLEATIQENARQAEAEEPKPEQ
ncbi:hypothetical protein MBLNU457_5873t1 [Dothideomycetes sp. NU457]